MLTQDVDRLGVPSASHMCQQVSISAAVVLCYIMMSPHVQVSIHACIHTFLLLFDCLGTLNSKFTVVIWIFSANQRDETFKFFSSTTLMAEHFVVV